MRNLKRFVYGYRMGFVALFSFFAGVLCVACFQGASSHLQSAPKSFQASNSKKVSGSASSKISDDARSANDSKASGESSASNEDWEADLQASSSNSIFDFLSDSDSDSTSNSDAESDETAEFSGRNERNTKNDSDLSADQSELNAKIDPGLNAEGSATIEIGTEAALTVDGSTIPTIDNASEAVVISRAVPFWETAEADEIFADLNLSEFLSIDAERAPQIGNATPDRILSDFQSRISPEFEVPELIFNQTKFWFRVYTEFDSNKKIIHDSLHPHIIYDIVDISEVLAQPTRAQWLNVVKAQKLVANRVNEVRSQLKKMARKKKEDMTTQELSWLSQFEGIRGNQKKIILTSAQSLRVQTGQKDFFEGALATSGRYLDGMESIFKDKGLPIELTRLPFVESSFVIGATSKVGAAGIWQFMPGVGRQFMQVNDRVDERRSPWKATEAAAKLLKENYTILHKRWGLALTAYNHGPGGVRKAMATTGSKDIAQIVRRYRSKSFDFASANFYTCFLAAVHAQMYRDLLWPTHITDAPLAYESIHLKRAYKPRQLVQMTGLSGDQILLYNPELDRSFKRNYVIPKGYRLFLPSEVKMGVQKVTAARTEAKTSSSVD